MRSCVSASSASSSLSNSVNWDPANDDTSVMSACLCGEQKNVELEVQYKKSRNYVTVNKRKSAKKEGKKEGGKESVIFT